MKEVEGTEGLVKYSECASGRKMEAGEKKGPIWKETRTKARIKKDRTPSSREKVG